MRHFLLAFVVTLFACGSEDVDYVGEVQLISYGQPSAAPKVVPESRRVIVMETCVVTPKPEPQPCDE